MWAVRTPILEMSFIKEITISEINREGIIFTDGSTLQDHHIDDCCEMVYTEWLYNSDNYGKNPFRKIEVYIEKGYGITLDMIAITEDGDIYKVDTMFFPCYNIQNGYYSDNLSLKFSHGNIAIEVDITKSTTESEI